MSAADHCLLVCESIHNVMRAEKALRAAGLWCDLIPLPRQLSSDCGMALEFSCGDARPVRALVAELAEPGDTAGRIYRDTGEGFEQLEDLR